MSCSSCLRRTRAGPRSKSMFQAILLISVTVLAFLFQEGLSTLHWLLAWKAQQLNHMEALKLPETAARCALESHNHTCAASTATLSVRLNSYIDYVKLRNKPKQNTKLKTRCYIGPNLVSATCSLMWPRQQSINLNVACCCFLAAFSLHLLQTTLKYCGHQHSKPLQQSAQIRSLQPEHQMTG